MKGPKNLDQHSHEKYMALEGVVTSCHKTAILEDLTRKKLRD